MTYLIVGLDRRTLAPWHGNIFERDVAGATRAALARACAAGVDLVVAAVIGPYSSVREGHANRSERLPNLTRRAATAFSSEKVREARAGAVSGARYQGTQLTGVIQTRSRGCDA